MIKSKDEIIAEEVKSINPKNILDVGYAQGPNMYLPLIGADIYGIDIVESPSPYKKTFKCDFNVDQFPFEDETFEVATMGCTLAHVAHPLKLLAEIHRVLKPGGILILTSPNPNYYWEHVINVWYEKFRNRVSKSKHVEHFFEFTRYSMRTILERTGFALIKELGATFQIVKTGIRINVMKKPGLAYEIIYIAKRSEIPEQYTIIEDEEGRIHNIKTKLF